MDSSLYKENESLRHLTYFQGFGSLDSRLVRWNWLAYQIVLREFEGKQGKDQVSLKITNENKFDLFHVYPPLLNLISVDQVSQIIYTLRLNIEVTISYTLITTVFQPV